MKLFASLTAVLLATVSFAIAAPIGPEVAVIQIKIGKDKQLRTVVIGFNDEDAPITVANFKELARKRYYDGLKFHRVFPGSLVQGGDPRTRWYKRSDKVGTGGPDFTLPAEIKLKHNRGSIAMSRLPNHINPSKASNGSQFYICLEPMPKLDGEYTVFGEVLEGLDILDEISSLPTNSNDFPLANVVIKSIKILPRFSEQPARP